MNRTGSTPHKRTEVGEESERWSSHEQEIRAAFQNNLKRRPDARGLKRRSAKVSNSRLHFGVGEARVDHLIQLADDFIGRVRARPAARQGRGSMRVVLLMRQILRVPHQLERVDRPARCGGSLGAIG
jgi:hypothetical protein